MVSLGEYLREQSSLVCAASGSTDVKAVHDTRVAIRRLRSALRVFEPLLDDAEAAHDVEEELRWLAGLLGDVRDRQVQRKRFAARELDTGFLERRLYDEQRRCEKTLRTELRGQRFDALRETLEAWSQEPPVRGESEASLSDCAHKAARTAKRRLRSADTDSALHRARKAAKRARYAAEMLERTHRVERFKRIQDVLGELQDTVVAGETLHRLKRGANHDEAFTLGALYGQELDRRDRLRREAHALT